MINELKLENARLRERIRRLEEQIEKPCIKDNSYYDKCDDKYVVKILLYDAYENPFTLVESIPSFSKYEDPQEVIAYATEKNITTHGL